MTTEKKNDETGTALSELFEMLSHKVRRRTLVAVGHHNPRDDDDITSDSIANQHEDDTLELLTRELHHVHLPKLDDAGFIDWDREKGLITRGPRFREIEPLLKLMHDHQDELPADWP